MRLVRATWGFLSRLLWVLCAASLAAAGVQAEDRSTGLSQFHHTAWSTRDGAPGPVLALAQTPDGRLWLGTPTGLFTYDGVEFTRIHALGGVSLPASAVRSLAVDRAGALWIGYLFGGASRYALGRLTNYDAAHGLPKSSSLARLAVGPDGAVWAAAVRGLYRFDGEKWVSQFPKYNIIVDVFVDRAARVWFVSKETLFVHEPAEPAGQARQVADAPWDDSSHMTEGPDGSLWLADRAKGLRRFGPDGALPTGAAVPKGPTAPVMFDRQGMAWYMGPGLWRSDSTSWTRPGDKVEAPSPTWFGPKEGLSGEVVYALLLDREGSVWAGTSGGLDRFRRTKLHRVAVAQEAQAVALAPAAGSDVWVGRSQLPLVRLGAAARDFPGINKVWTVYADPDGSTWVGSFQGNIWRIEGDTVVEVPPPKALGFGRPVHAFTRDRAGGLWVACSGIYRLEEGRWQDLNGKNGLPDDQPTQLYTDAQGRVWLGFTGSRLALYEGGRGRVFAPSDGIDVGTVLALAGTGDRLWIGGESGLAARIADRFAPLVGAGGTIFHSVSGAVETAAGELWLNSAEGIVRVPAAEVKRFIADTGYQPAFEIFDHRDGLDGRVSPIGAYPTLVAARDGRLWMSTPGSVVWIDPAAIARNAVPAPVAILSLKAGDQVLPPSEDTRLHALTSSLQIRYTAFSLALPERVRFRYRLDGVDTDWQEAGTRRTAFYTNLGPGKYRFEVLAANEDGVWSEQPAVLHFAIAPAFYQTSAFRIACVIAGLLLLGWLYLLRVHTLTKRTAEKVRERQIERERIAAELHDTLLQGVYGLLLQIQTVLHRLSDEPARQVLSRAADKAERLVNEGRDRVAGLRHTAPFHGDLPQALSRLALEATGGTQQPQVDVSIEGPVRDLKPEVQDEIYYIVREALLNVVKHARARWARVELAVLPGGVRLVVQDDGRGIPDDVLRDGGMPGHWGLQGMRDRAARVGGELSITCPDDGGTTLSLSIPRAAAHREPPRRWLRRGTRPSASPDRA